MKENEKEGEKNTRLLESYRLCSVDSQGPPFIIFGFNILLESKTCAGFKFSFFIAFTLSCFSFQLGLYFNDLTAVVTSVLDPFLVDYSSSSRVQVFLG
ncbi:hypothetical protein I3842_06G032500 [Carya illinoinensis]|uniref:Uncharacterized protein n=1 Tax=Carya illinoinensis TaxID=32201 RepID=A0A922EP09_CARIL|nr:hypothetical protein I3842_06G032500 [Carya illinoinensis]